MTDVPTISVITINRNTGHDVQRTIASVLGQDIPFEWVVVDGASSDDSITALRAALRPGDRCLSEPDRGISDAFNKGIQLASGDAVIFMNAGDEFASPEALRLLRDAWLVDRHDWITGTAQVIHPDGRILFRRSPRTHGDTWHLVRHGCRVFHQATLARRKLFLEYGGFDESFRIAMDYELWLRWMVRGRHPQVVDVTVCRYRTGGVSGNVRRRFAEDRRARAAYALINPLATDARLWSVAMLKSALGSNMGPWAYRMKERLGW